MIYTNETLRTSLYRHSLVLQAHRPEHVLEKVDTGLARWRPQQQQEQQQQQQEQEQPGPQGSESAQAAPGAQHEGTSPAPAGQGSIGADAAASDGTAAGGTAGGLGHARDEANRAQTDEPMDSNQVGGDGGGEWGTVVLVVGEGRGCVGLGLRI